MCSLPASGRGRDKRGFIIITIVIIIIIIIIITIVISITTTLAYRYYRYYYCYHRRAITSIHFVIVCFKCACVAASCHSLPTCFRESSLISGIAALLRRPRLS